MTDAGSGFERYKAGRRRQRVELWGAWAADDERWEQATGQRWPDEPPECMADGDAPGRSVTAVALEAAGQVAEGPSSP